MLLPNYPLSSPGMEIGGTPPLGGAYCVLDRSDLTVSRFLPFAAALTQTLKHGFGSMDRIARTSAT